MNAKKVGIAILPLKRPGEDPTRNEIGEWTVMKQQDVRATPIDGISGNTYKAPYLTIGCHYDGKVFKNYARMNTAFDELAIWTRRLEINRTHNEAEYFLGGYGKIILYIISWLICF